MLPPVLLAVAGAALIALSGCGTAVAVVDTAASLTGSAISVAGTVVETTASVVTAPFRSSGDDDEEE